MQQVQVGALQAIAEIAEDMSLGLVLDKSQLLLVAKGLEFSDRVIERLNRDLPSVPTAPAARERGGVGRGGAGRGGAGGGACPTRGSSRRRSRWRSASSPGASAPNSPTRAIRRASYPAPRRSTPPAPAT